MAKRKHPVLAKQPHETIRYKYFMMFTFMLLSTTFALNPLEKHLQAVQAGLTQVALYQKTTPLMGAEDAAMLLKDWYGKEVLVCPARCASAEQKDWNSYCQSLRIDCVYSNAIGIKQITAQMAQMKGSNQYACIKGKV